MARQRSSSFLKRQKELERQERMRLKRERRMERKLEKATKEMPQQEEPTELPEV